MRAPQRQDTSALVRLRVDAFNRMTAAVGCETDVDRAALIGVSPRTVRRAREGIVGEVFIASAILALRPHQAALAERGLAPNFDGLFEVVRDVEPAVA